MTTGAATLGDLLAETVARLRAAGVPAARREAQWLVADLAGLPAGTALLQADRAAPDGLAGRVREAAERRARGEPIAYVTGQAEFRHLMLAVDHRVLIPRPETEQLVELVLVADAGGRVVDVGTGSGCLALSLAQEGRFTTVVGLDRSAGALAVARANARRHGLRVHFARGDLLTAMAVGACDVVVSNPPYLSTAEYAALDASVAAWEPAEALVSGEDGLEATRRLLADAARVLRPGGLLALELDCSRAANVAALAARTGWCDVAVIADLFGRDRFLTTRRGPTR